MGAAANLLAILVYRGYLDTTLLGMVYSLDGFA